MLERSRKLTNRDFPENTFSDLPDLGATTIDKEAFLLAYHCHTSVDITYKLPTRKRIILMEMLKEQKEFESKEAKRK